MGSFEKIKVGILSSSMADYGIYLPLLRKLHNDPFFEIEVIAFGTHLLEKFGNTVKYIYEDGFKVFEVADTMSQRDLPADITLAMAKTMKAFSRFFSKKDYQLLFALGDRYEMFAAVAASVPFNIQVAHIHGGETTLGSIDNAFRNSISIFSEIHFVSAEIYKMRVAEISGRSDNVYNVGALSIDNLKNLKLYEIPEFKNKYGIDLSHPTILMTFHPETVAFENNERHIQEVIQALKQLKHYQIIITMPNADTKGLMMRKKLEQFGRNRSGTWLIETFGTKGYLSAMKYSAFMLGNTSSGFVEAAFFSKIVINLGDRQKGRILTGNIIPTPIYAKNILESVKKAERMEVNTPCNLYGDGNTANKIVSILKMKFQPQ